MSSAVAKPISITATDAVRVSGLLQTPARARACYVLAHGAGAGMDHPFMVAVAAELARRGIATLRYQFPYMERGARRPDPPQLAQATVRAAVAAALRLLPELPLIGGGKSFGGRMTSQTQAKVLRRGVFDQDRIDVVEPGAKLQLDKKLLAQFPEGYRHLAYLQTRVGLTVNRSRPGLDGPELEALYAKGADWLVGKTI